MILSFCENQNGQNLNLVMAWSKDVTFDHLLKAKIQIKIKHLPEFSFHALCMIFNP